MLTKEQARKLYGLIAFVFRDFNENEHTGSTIVHRDTVMTLIPIHEAIAVQLDRLQGMNPDISNISLEGLRIGGIK
jgi:hypothetical protein